MTWLTWRQFRAQGAAIYAALAALAVTLAATGAHIAELSRVNGNGFLRAFTSEPAGDTVYYVASIAVLALPAIIGVFWGAPLVARELEAGTHRLVWNQSVTRERWLATKLGVTGLAAAAGVGVLSLTLSWWSRPIDAAINADNTGDGLLQYPRLAPLLFDARGLAPIGFTVFALALGVAAGIVIRRTVPAMALTLVVFVAVQVAMPNLVRERLAPAELTTTITSTNIRGMMAAVDRSGRPLGPVRDLTVTVDRPGAWIIANQSIDASGKVTRTLPGWVATCAGPPGPERKAAGDSACFARLADAGYRQRVTYQPAGRYWAFQAYETAIFAALAALLVGFSFWWLRHRVA
jgi:hypothetical protein